MSSVTPAASSAAISRTDTESAFTKASGDFEMFLTLLTTQMQNQDPLDPLDSSEYTQQLVQYSQVEQSIQQTQVLKDIAAQLSAHDLSRATGFIGRTVEYDLPQATLGDRPANWTWQSDVKASSLFAKITDAAGRTIYQQAVAADGTSGNFSWDGRLADGTDAARGTYTLQMEGRSATGVPLPVTIRGTGRVTEVATAGGAVELYSGDIAIPVADLIRVAETGN